MAGGDISPFEFIILFLLLLNVIPYNPNPCNPAHVLNLGDLGNLKKL